MKKPLLSLLLAVAWTLAQAQESRTSYNFLRLPVSAHVAALGGDNITISDDDPTLVYHNPALAANCDGMQLSLNYMGYMDGAKCGGATFVKAAGRRATWAAVAQYMDYGEMLRRDAADADLGSFRAKDILLGGTFTYTLTNKLAGGVTAKVVSSSIDGYNAMAVGVDLGLNYYDEERGISVSAVARNLGGEVDAFDDNFERMPLDLQLGVSKKLRGAPLRLSAAMIKLNDWDTGLIRHFVVGADLLLGDNIYIAGGYNFRRVADMKVWNGDTESAHGAGLSFGGGIQLQRLKLQVAYAKYHVTTSSLTLNVSYKI